MSARRMNAGISGSVTKRSTKRTVPGARAASSRSCSIGIRGIPTIQSSAPRDAREGLEQDVCALVGADEAEGEDHRALDLPQLLGQLHLVGLAGEVVEGAVGDHLDALGADLEVVGQPAGAVLGVDDHGVHLRQQPWSRCGRSGCPSPGGASAS